ncbi:ladinin-1 isoform 2-T2 [Discoglossus pictus]
MATGRRLSALSRLAQQWSEDDSEEQIRERRRRNRILSSEGEKLNKGSTAVDSSRSPTASSDATTEGNGFKKISKEETVKGQQNNEIKGVETQRPERQKVENQKPMYQKEEIALHGSPKEENRVQESLYTSSQNETKKEPGSPREVNQMSNSQEKDKTFLGSTQEENQVSSIQEDEIKSPQGPREEIHVATSQKHERIESKSACKEVQLQSQKELRTGPSNLRKEWPKPANQKEENKRPESQRNVSQAFISPKIQNQEQRSTDLNSQREEKQKPIDTKVQRTVTKVQDTDRSTGKQDAGSAASITSISSAVVTSTSPPPDTESRSNTVTSPSSGSSPVYRSQVFVSSVKITRKPSISDKDGGQQVLSPSHVIETIEESAPFVTRSVKKVEVQIPSTRRTSESSKEDELPNSPPPPSPLIRCSPRTSSFRAMTQNEDQGHSGLTRSSSLRFSLRSGKLGDRMNKYASAVQRSESVRIPSSHSRGVLGQAVGIASKRSIFEKDESSTEANTVHTRKEFKIPANVSSRINQWKITEMQPSAEPSTVTKEIKTGDVATKRSLWQQRSQSSTDTKL